MTAKPDKVVDLLAALEASIKAAKEDRNYREPSPLLPAPDPRVDIVWPLLARPNCDLWERHQAEQLAARILQALDEQETR